MIGVVTKYFENSQLWFKMPEPMNNRVQRLLALATSHRPARIVTRFVNLRSPSMLISGFVLEENCSWFRTDLPERPGWVGQSTCDRTCVFYVSCVKPCRLAGIFRF